VDGDISRLKKTDKVYPYELDITDWKALKAMFLDVTSKYGQVDVLVNNAGIMECMTILYLFKRLTLVDEDGNFWADEDAESYPTIDINLTALVKSTRLAISTFLRQPKPKDGGPVGIIVNTTSIAGLAPCFPAPIYAASKWGIFHDLRSVLIEGSMGFTRSMDYLHTSLGIRCVGLAPAAFHNPPWPHENASRMDNNDDWVPLNEVVDALLRCIKDEDIKGGEILEVLSGKTRILPLGELLSSGAGVGPAVEGFENACEKVVSLLNEQKQT
jgi:NAD(P)-dependent dehydrogenase (short-subunit alcohol dehydrogenase family)